MATAAFLAGLTLVGAKNLAIGWSDCSDDTYHAKINAVSPSVISMSGAHTITGSGILDKDISDAVSFDLAMETQFEDCKGDASVGGKCNFPLNMGSIEFKGIAIPAKAGEISIPVDLEISRLLPAGLMETTTLVLGKGKTSGKTIFCLNVYTKKSDDSSLGHGVLDVAWSDCGDSDTKSLVHDLTPAQLTQGSIQNIVGVGTLSEDVNEEIEWESSMRVKFVSCAGDAAKGKKCNFPLNLGSIAFEGIQTPVSAGQTDVSVTVSMSKLVPQGIAITTTHVTATSAGGDKLFCLDVNTDAAPDDAIEV